MFTFLFGDKIVSQVVTLLAEQIDEAKVNNPSWNERFGSIFVLGYIMGFSTILIKSKTKDDTLTAKGIKNVFEGLFGNKNGIRMMQTASMYQDELEFKNGFEMARKDLIEFIDRKGDRPQRLLTFLRDNS